MNQLVGFGRRCFLFIAYASALLACNSKGIDWAGMNASQAAYDQRVSQRVVEYMSLEVMFPDSQVRELAAAAGRGKSKRVKELVAGGIDVNSRGASNATPLIWAMRSDSLEGFIQLLDLGADPNVLFDDGTTVMHMAAGYEDVAFLQAALERGGNVNLVAGPFAQTPLFSAIGLPGSGNDVAIGLLLDAGADIDAADSRMVGGILEGRQTPAMRAADLGRFDIVYELLSRGANYTRQDSNGLNVVDRISEAAANKAVFVPGSSPAEWLDKVIQWLSARGVNVE